MQEQALSSFTSPQQSLALALWPEPWGCISGNLGPQSPGWEANCSATNQKSSKSAGEVASREPLRQFSSLWLQPPAMFPVATGTRGSSQDLLTAGPAPPGNAKDILLIHEEDAEEWALYLKEIFVHIVEREAILLYPLWSFSSSHLELQNLKAYKCKLLILSNSLLKDITPKRCQFLEKILHSPESVVTLLCGMESSHSFFELLNVPRSRWEISTEQEPEDYISVVRQILYTGYEDYLEVSIPTEPRAKHSEETSGQEKTDDQEASGVSVPLALVLPEEIPCENPGEIFILLKDELMGEILEVEFISDNKCLRTRPARWSKSVWCLKAADFPPGSVTVNIHCDGIIKATTEIKYCSAAKATESPFRMSEPGKSLDQKGIEELDGVLASIFKHEIPYYEFKPLQTETYPQKEYTHTRELPTLLHCAAKFGLKHLALHLLQCSGATWAAGTKNTDGSDLLHIAEQHGHEELLKIFEEFMIQNISKNNEQENDYEEDVTSFSTNPPSTQPPVFHHELGKTHRRSTDRSEEAERAGDIGEKEPSAEARASLPEVDGDSSEKQYDDLYVFIPGIDAESNSQEPLPYCRPPLPPPRPGTAASQLERPHLTSQGRMMEDQVERSQNWSYLSARQETREEPSKEERRGDEGQKAEEQEEEEENPYAFAETDDNEYDMILASKSVKKRTGNRSFIINRPPAPTPRPTHVPFKEETTPYIAQVFQQKAARRQSVDDKFYSLPKKPDKARIEGPTFSSAKGYVTTGQKELILGQEELILLQEKVKNGKMSMDEALEKFKRWQMGKSGLEMIQQEKLRQLRDSIVGKRPEDENAYDKLTIVHHPSGNTTHNENTLYSSPFNNKLPPRLQVEKEFGFCCKKDH
ncbi:B-cell scaffold protein with ankyrin repeats isoform X2 [Cricetulus griseus]|uniref:B-cell scaffold protein with ankyrin repeats n=2 Tax=Cricetulus griseus TaxID=10029 RepID=A0A9J7F7V1_CRIGR|nr:B-cell scaffold protein with ankyrin repeats isoform X2 [Cricetulus griseus]